MEKISSTTDPEESSSSNVSGTSTISISPIDSSTSTFTASKKLSPEQQEDVSRLIHEAVQAESIKIRQRFNGEIQKQQEKLFTVTAVLTAVLAFIATQAIILKDATANAIISVSCISTGGLLLFAYIILSVLRSEKGFRRIFYFSISLVISGILLTGWSPKDIINNARSLFTHDSTQQLNL